METVNYRQRICGIMLLTGIIFLPVAGTVHAQNPDSLIALKDTLKTDAGLDTTIFFGADRREIDIRRNIMVMYGTEAKSAWLTYKGMTLEAYKITNYGNDSLIAEGMRVQADPDSFPDGYKYVGAPVFNRTGDEPITGVKMVFNLRTEKGSVVEGRTKFEGGYYFGENITRLNEKYLQIQDGYYTTCDDEEHPHYYFRASQMKMTIGDKVVARPVVLYFSDVPVFIVPFALFPITGGRSSGFVVPSYGSSAAEGRYLRGMGYYFAPSDYMDAKVLMDFYDKSGVMFRGDARYAVRYKMSGSLSGSITRKNFSERADRRWDMRINHSQRIDPTMNLTVSGQFQSDNSFRRDFSLNRDVRATRRIYSSAFLTKQWEGTKNSITVTASREQDLVLGNVIEKLPSVNFSRSAPTYPFRRGAGTAEDGGSGRFYSTFNFSYNSSLQNNRSKTRIHEDSTFTERTRRGVQHNLNFSSPQRLFGYLAVNPAMRYREEWYNEATVKTINKNGALVTGTENGFFSRRTFTINVGANTKMYGMFNPNIGSLKSIRHVISPSIGFSYAPDFSDERYGYFRTVTDTSGNVIKYDRFEKALFGRTPSYKSKTMSLSLQNLFQVKTQSGETENKFDIANIGFSTSYNFYAARNAPKWSNLVTSVRILKFASLTLSAAHSFYEFSTGSASPPKLLYDGSAPLRKRRLLRFVNMSASTSFKLSGGKPAQKKEEAEEQPDPFAGQFADPRLLQGDPQDRFEQKSDLSRLVIPWDLQVSLNYAHSRNNPAFSSRSFRARTTFSARITKNWRVNHRANIDLLNREIISQDFEFYRDLHCWELTFRWTPSHSSRAGFSLEIRVKDPKLSDLKLRKTEYGGSAIGFIR